LAIFQLILTKNTAWNSSAQTCRGERDS